MPTAAQGFLKPSEDDDGWGIEVVGLYKAFGPLSVLRGVNLRARQGERMLLLGPNGSGKTTLIKILATLVRPTAGQGRLQGLDVVAQGAAVRPFLGTLCHQTFLYGDLTVQENLAFYGRMYRVGNLDGRLRELLKEWDLTDWAWRPVRELSRGMQQRAALARTFLHHPQVLLLDEPDTGLDERSFTILQRVLAEAVSRGCTVLLTSHNLRRGLELADRVAILAAGRVVFEGTKSELDYDELEGTYRRLAAATA